MLCPRPIENASHGVSLDGPLASPVAFLTSAGVLGPNAISHREMGPGTRRNHLAWCVPDLCANRPRRCVPGRSLNQRNTHLMLCPQLVENACHVVSPTGSPSGSGGVSPVVGFPVVGLQELQGFSGQQSETGL